MTSITTITTLVSGAYTLYCIHPFIPYRFVWTYMAVPALNFVSDTATRRMRQQKEVEKEIECYEIISESKDPDTGIITRYLILKQEEPFTMINYETASSNNNEPVWL